MAEPCIEGQPCLLTRICDRCHRLLSDREDEAKSLRAALQEAETQRRLVVDSWRDALNIERGRAEALEAALRRFEGDGPTIINDETTRHFAGCDGYACRKPNPVMDAYRCKLAREALRVEQPPKAKYQPSFDVTRLDYSATTATPFPSQTKGEPETVERGQTTKDSEG